MFLKIHVCISLFLYFGATKAFDPFEGNIEFNCLKGRQITGCNETLLQAYMRTEASKTDRNINKADTRVYLFTRRNPEHPELINECGGRLPSNTLFQAQRKIVIIVGGHLSSFCSFGYFQDFKNQLLYRDDYNLFYLDWFWGNGADIYGSMRNCEVVGKQLAFLIQNLMEQKGISASNIHIIGHAYGAHVAGFAGRYLTGGKIGRITGLDPFGGAFITVSEDYRLDPSDADLVDVIHTGGGSCFPFALGTSLKSGHVDFYPNGGSVQLSCLPAMMESFLKGDLFIATLSLYPAACFLFQSIRYFLVSINACQCQFVGLECDSYADFQSRKCGSCRKDGSNCAVMGMDLVNYPHKTGNYSYYLETGILCPYCKNDINSEGFTNYAVGNSSEIHCFKP